MTARLPDELGGAIGRFRELRRRFEQAIPAAAVSMDGRSFGYQLSIGSTVPPPDGFVALVDGETHRLGQLIAPELVTRDGPEVGASLDGESLFGDGALDLQARVQVRVVEGTGVVLSGDGAPFVDARIEEATGPEVAELSRPKRDTVDLVIGTVLAGRDEIVPARIDAGGFDRHTFLCGQSGSGKTYSLGVTDVFSFVPPSLLARATGFRQGEALVAGKVVPTPTFVRFGASAKRAAPTSRLTGLVRVRRIER